LWLGATGIISFSLQKINNAHLKIKRIIAFSQIIIALEHAAFQ
jgi:hypothetical protein